MTPRMIFAGIAICALVAGCGGQTDAADGTRSAAAGETSVPAAGTAASSDTASPTAVAVDAQNELKAAVQAYSDAFLTGDPKAAYELLSQRCRKRHSLAEFTSIVSAAEQMYGSALPIETFSAQVSGDLARVTYTYSVKAINQDSEPWAREQESWRQDDC
ncbi:nuclear transport factor 2 family protein [Actinoplanes derwentensis]|uniref:Lipoprotein n=1 Tax=Actinoplanes derwentensis TaxID=113562 RepID=A0A1H2CW57_9ACTN|nr:nuclear transport factor 2 family protein [Actinoplanes derwentensis]GID81975.1 hypothetical protein Ade03nite_08990 [Actinoplanes derwentensis]SDT74256.1 hypothetical protein SAMN04489716_6924 [Actinoplanes derwentensis]